MLTGNPLRLKRLSKNGTLISIGVDMELAQALGAGDSFLPTNEPGFSNIHVQTAEEIIEFFIRACYTHAKRFVHIFLLFQVVFRLIIILNTLAGAYMTSSPTSQIKSMTASLILCILRRRKKSMSFRHG